MKTTLANGCQTLGLDISDRQIDAMMDYLAQLVRWNKRINLTAVRHPDAMLTHHLLDSLAIAPHVHGERCVDVGTGAGLPGIPLAIIAPEKEFLLIDSNGKKTSFLLEAKRVLGLTNVAVKQCRVEDYRPGAGFDTVMCRAFAPLPRLVTLAGHLVAANGIIAAQKGRFPDEEIQGVPADWQVHTTSLSVPGLDKERRLVTLTRR